MRTIHQLIIAITLLFGLLNAWRALGLIKQREVLLTYNATPAPDLLIALSILWSLIFLGCAGAAWRQLRPLRLLIPVIFSLYTLYNVWLPGPSVPGIYVLVFLMIFTAIPAFRGHSQTD